MNVLLERPPVATRRRHIPVWLRILGLCVLAVPFKITGTFANASVSLD